MKEFIYIIAFLFFSAFCDAQNLVPNPSFEQGTCPSGMAQISNAASWNVPLGHLGSSDYFSRCGASDCWVPINDWGTQQPATGDAYAGLCFWLTSSGPGSYREYLQVQLTSPLLAGYVYRVSAKCSFRILDYPNGSITTDGLGMYLSSLPVVSPPNDQPIPVVPQYQPAMWVAETGWTEVGFDYTAQGGEQYLLLGNFKENGQTLIMPSPDPSIQYFYYFFIDDVSVIPFDMQVSADTQICQGDSVTLTATHSSTYAWADANAPDVIISTSDSIRVSPSETSTYYVFGNYDTLSVTVEVTPSLSPIYLGNDTLGCMGDTVLLTARPQIPGAQYQWQNGSTLSDYHVTQSGAYWVRIMLGSCWAADTVQVGFDPKPDVDLGPDKGLCPGADILLDVSMPDASYLWQDQSTEATFGVNLAGTYTVTVSLGNCKNTDSITVVGLPNPVFDLGDSISLCMGEPLTLDATVQNATYLWQDNSTGPTFSPTQSGMYSVEVALGSCSLADSVDVLFHFLPMVSLGNDLMPCTGTTIMLDVAQPGITYRWQDGSNLPTYTVMQSGTYTVEVFDANGCKNNDVISVDFISPPDFNFVDSTFCFGDIWTLDITTPLAGYLWQDKSVAPVFTITGPGIYWATATNHCGSDSDTLEVTYRRCDCHVFVPNSFTPDQNKENEMFSPIANPGCGMENYTLTIYDRWGGVIFESQNIEFGWNGKIKDMEAPLGIYTYTILYKYEKDIQQKEWGTIALMR